MPKLGSSRHGGRPTCNGGATHTKPRYRKGCEMTPEQLKQHQLARNAAHLGVVLPEQPDEIAAGSRVSVDQFKRDRLFTVEVRRKKAIRPH